MSAVAAAYKNNCSNNISFTQQSFGGFTCDVKAATANAKKALVSSSPDKKAMAALKSHSDAERRRRERINSHLATLRCLLPFTQKMDKASLLAEVIRQVKELKENAMEASKGLVIPTDSDEVKVEACKVADDNVLSFKATICCGFHRDLLSQVRKAIEQVRAVKLAKVQMCTVGGRLKTEFLFTIINNAADNKISSHKRIIDSVHRAITCVLENNLTSSVEYLPPPNKKRRRLSSSNNSSSSSSSYSL